jgi:hypothetical protein
MHGSSRKDRRSVPLAIHLYDGTNIRQHNNRKVGVGSRQGRHTLVQKEVGNPAAISIQFDGEAYRGSAFTGTRASNSPESM